MAKILVIDDEASIRGLLATLLERKGYEVVLASSGQKGLEQFRRESPDLTVLDLKMPDMDGLAVLRKLRALNDQKAVIILTEAAEENAEIEARLLGATAFIEKECSLHRLGETIASLLTGHKSLGNPSSR